MVLRLGARSWLLGSLKSSSPHSKPCRPTGCGTVTRLLGQFESTTQQSQSANCDRCIGNIPEQRIIIDFNEEKGRVARPGQRPPPEDKCYVIIRPTATVDMSVISSYLDGTMPQFDVSILAAISKSKASFMFG